MNQMESVINQSREKLFPCLVCEKTFRLNGNLTKHMKIHTGDKPFQCKECGNRFTKYGSLERHMKIHTGVKPYRCEVCEKTFREKGNLLTHMRIHTGETPFTCEVCEQRFYNSHHLQLHKTTHTGERPFHCDVCEMKFSRGTSLKKHKKVHSEERPFRCEVCTKTFKINDNLVRHMRVHTGVKPYQCTVCDKTFTTSGNLQRHLKIHTNEKSYFCDMCIKAFSSSSDLQRHVKVHIDQKGDFQIFGPTKRRIRDLFSEDIPEDEALLLSNGRLSCTVCHHKPVFDTIDMLMVHRNGKKHQANIEDHERKKDELIELIKKRKHEQFQKTGSTDIKIAEVHLKSLVGSAAYDPRVKKKLKPFDRKPKIMLSNSVAGVSSSSLPGNRWNDMVALQQDGPLRHPNQLNKIFDVNGKTKDFHVTPYQRKTERTVYDDNYTNTELTTESIPSSSTGLSCNKLGSDSFAGVESDAKISDTCVKTDRKKKKSAPKTYVPPEKKELAQKYWQMAGSGWKKDWDGKWIRDEDCEFDSDEEEPDLP